MSSFIAVNSKSLPLQVFTCGMLLLLLLLCVTIAPVQRVSAAAVLTLDEADAAVEFGTAADAKIRRTGSAALEVTGATTFLHAIALNGTTSVNAATTLNAALTVAANSAVTFNSAPNFNAAGFRVPFVVANHDGGSVTSVPPATGVPLPFANTLQTGGNVVSSAGATRFTAPISGIYHICASVLWGAVPGTDAQLIIVSSTDGDGFFFQSGSTLAALTTTCGDLYLPAGAWAGASVWIGASAPANSIAAFRRRFSMRFVTAV